MLRIFQHPIIMLYFSVPRVDTLQFVCDIDHRTNEIPNHFYGKRKQCEEGGIGETTRDDGINKFLYCYAEVKHSDWLLKVTRLPRLSQSLLHYSTV